uniref:Nuclear pore protein n=1 Tax=Parastrongyloides trichosuri TaxID=131310 RepID=A0A0N4ZGA7_PARTI
MYKPRDIFSLSFTNSGGLNNDINCGQIFDDVTEATLMDADILFSNRRAVEIRKANSIGGPSSKMNFSINKKTFPGKKKNLSIPERLLPQLQKALADEIQTYVLKKNPQSLSSYFQKIIDNNKEIVNNQIWKKVLHFFNKPIPNGYKTTLEFRQSQEFHEQFLTLSIVYLQKEFKEHMENIVQKNLKIAKRGGRPGNEYLIEAFLKVVRLKSYFDIHDGTFGSHPIWQVLFCSIRMGDYQLVGRCVDEILNPDEFTHLIKYLKRIKNNIKLSEEELENLKVEYDNVVSKSGDPYKRAVYAAFLNKEVNEVNDNLENWIWSKLMSVHVSKVDGISKLISLQILIKEECGEDYFVGDQKNYTMYFGVLWLTCQFEAAIDVLNRGEYFIEAVHIALLCHEADFLLISPNLSDDMISPSSCTESKLYGLNFPKLMIYYMQRFEDNDIYSFIAYGQFLKNFETSSNENLFAVCVSRVLCDDDEQRDNILGYITEDGSPVEGILHRYGNICVNEVVAQTAKDLNFQGKRIESIKLYILIHEMQIAAKILCDLLASIIVTNGKNRSMTLEFAAWFYNLILQAEYEVNDDEISTTLKLLIDLGTFFEYAHEKRNREAIQYMQKFEFLPQYINSVQKAVETYYGLTPAIRMILPDILLSYVNCLVDQINDQNDETEKLFLKEMGQALFQYVGRIPYKFPPHIHLKLLQLFGSFK